MNSQKYKINLIIPDYVLSMLLERIETLIRASLSGAHCMFVGSIYLIIIIIIANKVQAIMQNKMIKRDIDLHNGIQIPDYCIM